MKRVVVGVVDYAVGNLASVKQSIESLGYRTRISNKIAELEKVDCLFLPGVGAFPSAMKALSNDYLDRHIIERALSGTPIIGICLGMQLLLTRSYEVQETKGLGLIPGEVIPLRSGEMHVGWNDLEVVTPEPMFSQSHGDTVYFNHSFMANTDLRYYAAVSRMSRFSDPFPVAIHCENIVGLQFHPEKSQEAGRQLLRSLVDGLCDA